MQVARLLSVLAAAAVSAASGQLITWFALGWRHEPGVESKMLVTGRADYRLGRHARLDAGLGLGLFENAGINGYGLGVSVLPLGSERLTLTVTAQHQQWSDWRAGENRLLLSAQAAPLSLLSLRLGAAYRAPQFEPGSYYSPFRWRSDAPEWNLLYGIDWFPFRPGRFGVVAFLSNFDQLRQHNPQQLPLGLHGWYSAVGDWVPNVRLSTAITGLSAMLISFDEVVFEAGVSRAF